jgi:hypothetical protein
MGDVPVDISIYSVIDDEPRTELVGGLRIPSGKFGFRTAHVALPACYYSTQFELYTSSHKWVKQVRHLSLVICHWSLWSLRTNDQ